MNTLRQLSENQPLDSKKVLTLITALVLVTSCSEGGSSIGQEEIQKLCNARAQVMAGEALKAWEIPPVVNTAITESCQAQHQSGRDYKMHSYVVDIDGRIENCTLGFNIMLRPGKQAPIISTETVNGKGIDYDNVPAALPTMPLTEKELTMWQILRTKGGAATDARLCAPLITRKVESVPGAPLQLPSESSRPLASLPTTA